MSERFSHYKRQLKRSIEMAAFETGKRPKRELVGDILNSELTKRERVTAAFSLVLEMVPEQYQDMERLRSFFYNPDSTWLNLEDYSFEGSIGAGGECEAFLLQAQKSGQPSYALKVMHLEGEVDTLLEIAKEFQAEYIRLKELYGEELPGLIPSEATFIDDDPTKKEGSRVITIQTFMGRDIEDIFRLDRQELIDSLVSDEHLREDFIKFVDITIREFEESGRIYDIGGHNNLVLAQTEKGKRLRLIDPHEPTGEWKIIEGERKERQLAQIQYLKDIGNELKRERNQVAF